jgi:putative MFS transporter
MRATVTTTVPNFVRGSLVPVAMVFDFFKERYGLIEAGYIVAAIVFGLSFFALYNTKETFGRDLDFIE